MAAIKILLWKHYKKKDEKYPIALRITKDRKPRYIFTGKYILEKDWDSTLCRVKKSHPNSARLNNYLLKKLAEADDILLESTSSNEMVSTKQIQKKVKRKGKKISFFQHGAQRVKDKYDKGTFSVARSELSILYNIKEFINLKDTGSKQSITDAIKERRKTRHKKGANPKTTIMLGTKSFEKDETLYFADVDMAFINKFKSFCRTYLNHKERTLTNQLIFIRTLYNNAIKEGIANKKYYPFAGENEKIRIKSSQKIGLTKEEVTKIENLEAKANSAMWHTKNVWLFSYYFAGIRISDVLTMRWSDFVDDRLLYVMNKNNKSVSLKIPQKALTIIEHYKKDKDSKNDFVFPFLKKADLSDPEDVFVKARNATSLFNKYLKRIAISCEIDKNLSNHIARHTFGNIAGDKISPLMLQKLYRHSDLKTTIGYQANFIHKDADDALDAVIN
jgi:integrase